MSYGAQILNDLDSLLLTDINLAPWFAGKGSAGAVGAFAAGGSGYDVATVTYTFAGGGAQIIAMTLPVNAGDVWYAPNQTLLFNGSPYFSVQIFRPSGGAAAFAMPEAYAFTVGGSPPRSSGWGLQVFDGASNLLVDTGRSPLAMQQIISRAIGDGASTLANMPAKPAFILFAVQQEVGARVGTTQSSTIKTSVGAFRLASAASLQSKMIQMLATTEDSVLAYNNQNGNFITQALPVINAANYD